MANTAAETYLAIAHRAQNPENYPAVQIEADLHALLHATADLIRENSSLTAKTVSADAYVAQLEIQLFNRDIELFSAISQLDNPDGGLLTV